MKRILIFICLYSEYISFLLFFIYTIVYILGRLYEKSVVFNYIIILLAGVYIGYKFAKSAVLYLRKNSSK